MANKPTYEELLAENQRLKQRIVELEQQMESLTETFVIPKLMRDLLIPRHRETAFEQLLTFGEKAKRIFLSLLKHPKKTLQEFRALEEREPLTGEFYKSLMLMAINGLVRLQAEEATEPLLELIKSNDTRLRLRALWALGKLRASSSDEVVQQIFELIKDPSDVKKEALELLVDLGNTAAIPLIIPFLGDLRIEGGFRLSEHAANALRRLGAGEIVSAFYRVVNEGSISDLEQLRPYRKPVIEALIRALDSYLSDHVENAAKALKAWNAVEALPKLKSKLRWAWLNLSDSTRKVCEEAVKHLEDISRLPAPASLTQFPVDTLPRPADPTSFSPETLPYPAKAPKEHQNST